MLLSVITTFKGDFLIEFPAKPILRYSNIAAKIKIIEYFYILVFGLKQ